MSHDSFAELLKPIFEKHSIMAAYLFGSIVSNESTPMSDIDIAVLVSNPDAFSFNDKLLLHADCCRVLKRNDVDLVVINQAKNLILQDEIVRNGRVIFDQDAEGRMLFEIKIQHMAIDFKHQRKMNMGI